MCYSQLCMSIQIKRLSFLALVATLATTVLLLSYPRFTSSISFLPVHAALNRHWDDYPIKSEQFPVLIQFANKAIDKLDLARYWQGLGWLFYLQINAENIESGEGQQLLARSLNAFETSLQKSPADPVTWLRVAWLHAWLRHDTKLVLKALNMSIYTGRAERYLIIDRLNLALYYEAYFDKQDLPIIRDQIQLAWRFYPRDMLTYMESGELDKYVLLGLIADTNPGLAKEIEDKL